MWGTCERNPKQSETRNSKVKESREAKAMKLELINAIKDTRENDFADLFCMEITCIKIPFIFVHQVSNKIIKLNSYLKHSTYAMTMVLDLDIPAALNYISNIKIQAQRPIAEREHQLRGQPIRTFTTMSKSIMCVQVRKILLQRQKCFGAIDFRTIRKF